MSARRLSRPAALTRHVVLLLTAAVVLMPFVWMLSLSVKPPGEIFRASFRLLPEQWHFVGNYGKALTAAPLPRFMLNGVFVCTAILALQILSARRQPMRWPSCASGAGNSSSPWFWSAC